MELEPEVVLLVQYVKPLPWTVALVWVGKLEPGVVSRVQRVELEPEVVLVGVAVTSLSVSVASVHRRHHLVPDQRPQLLLQVRPTCSFHVWGPDPF